MKTINAENKIVGRLASKVAKDLLKGETINIINCEKAIISGNPVAIKKKYLRLRKIGDRFHGPFFPRYPDKFLRRTIRGMLPYKKPKGKDALKRLKIYAGHPEDMKEDDYKLKTIKELKSKFITMKDLCRHLGAKVD